ncbi:MAG TPA: hypothetical protein VKT80_14355, partial [Chloroflexota bacterium]|nr:hypothetical protein [Chloroflexota bacterium]
MAKTVAPLTFEIPAVGKVTANALPDPFDARDFEYRPRLQLLPTRLDQRDIKVPPYVMLQQGESCTGHAIATVINTVLAHADRPREGQAPLYPVSPYMLYRLGRRYDEFQGEADAGSSLRGVLKGWFNHGVSLLVDWPNLVEDPEPDPGDPTFQQRCRPRPLGAFYRVNPFRLDDMQSAISELHAIA